MTRGRVWTDDERAGALAALRELGVGETHRRTGIPKTTLSRWAKAAGMTGYTRPATAAQLEALEAANVERQTIIAASRARQILTLNLLAEEGMRTARALVEIAEASRDPRHLAGVVGAFTRAVHDVQLLTGQDTERAAVEVHFGYTVDDADDLDIIDVVPEARLADVLPLEKRA